MSLDELFDNLRPGPWHSDPNFVPQEGTPGAGNIPPSGWLADDSVSADVIQANAVTAAKIQAGAITADKIEAGSITANKIATGAVTADKIAASAVTADKIAANSITANKIAANSITASEIAAGAITASELAADSVIASKIATNAVTADAIAANSITASEIQANAVTTAKILAGNVTSSRIEVNVSGKNFGANFGSSGAPGIYFDSNSDTGISGNSGALTLNLNSAPRLSIQSSIVTIWGAVLPGISPQNIGGVGSARWGVVYCQTLNQSSDARLKTDIKASPLGLDFIRSLRPVAYRWKDTADTQTQQAAALDEKALESEIAPWREFIELSSDDRDDSDVEAGVEIAREQINSITRQHLAPYEAAQGATRAGRREHYGLVAQEVKQSLDEAGVDAAFWQEDVSGEQSLLYTELMGPLIRAVQELADRIEDQSGKSS